MIVSICLIFAVAYYGLPALTLLMLAVTFIPDIVLMGALQGAEIRHIEKCSMCKKRRNVRNNKKDNSNNYN